MTGLLLLGFLIGMRHALEADHVAAVASLATSTRSVADTVRQGVAWGLGHTATLFLFGSAVLVAQLALPATVARRLELAVGVMLLVLGADVIRRLIRDRVHFHFHRHADGTLHFHAHTHAGESGPHDPAHHSHPHPARPPLRALMVGMMHGMAGSAALLMLTVSTVPSPAVGLAYILLFGLGSVAGMAMLSAVIALPLHHRALRLTRVHAALQMLVGVATMALGASVVWVQAAGG